MERDLYVRYQVLLENLKTGEASKVANMLLDQQQIIKDKLLVEGLTDWSRDRLVSQLKTSNTIIENFHSKDLLKVLRGDGIEFIAKTKAYYEDALVTSVTKASVEQRLAAAEFLGFETKTPLYKGAVPGTFTTKDLARTAKVGKFVLPREGMLDFDDTNLRTELAQWMTGRKSPRLGGKPSFAEAQDLVEDMFRVGALDSTDEKVVATFLGQKKKGWTSYRTYSSDLGDHIYHTRASGLAKSMYTDFTKMKPVFADQGFVAVHKDIRSASKATTRASILQDGFRKGANVNALPLRTYTGKGSDVISQHYAKLKKNDVVYLLRKDGVIDGKNGYQTRTGFVPGKGDAVRIEYDGQDLEEAWQRHQAKLLSPTDTIPVEITAANLSPSAIYTAATAEPMQDKLMSAWASQLGQQQQAMVKNTLTQGWLAGQSVGKSAKDLGAVFAKGVRDLRTITRTFYQHLASETQRAVWNANSEIIDGLIWDATLDNRTTLEICAPRDQKKYTLGGKPIDHGYSWMGGPGQAHWNCRSTGIPWIKGHENTGVDRRALGAGEKYTAGDDKTLTGKVRKDSLAAKEKGIYQQERVKRGTTYSQWLKTQSPAFQDDVLGPVKGKAFRQGTYKLGEKFTPGRPVKQKDFLEKKTPPPPPPKPRKTGGRDKPIDFGKGDMGAWGKASFGDSPRPLQKAIEKHLSKSTRVIKDTPGAYYKSSTRAINMGRHSRRDFHGQGVFRHEAGHALDNQTRGLKTLKGPRDAPSSPRADHRIPRGSRSKAYRSGEADFTAAMKKDRLPLIRQRRADDLNYNNAKDLVAKAAEDQREAVLRSLAQDVGIDYDDFFALTQKETDRFKSITLKVSDDVTETLKLQAQQRFAQTLTAIDMGDAEKFYYYFAGTPGSATSSANFKRGSSGFFSDLIGSVTDNLVNNYSDGFPGHSSSYYKSWDGAAPTETFANLTALYGNPNPVWGRIVERFVPTTASLYKEILGL